MMAPGHLMVALTTYHLSTKLGASNEPWLYGVALIGGLLPDIDEPRSMINNMLQFISRPIGELFSHRGFTHSLLALIVLFWGLATVLNGTPSWLIALWVGYASHLLADFHTKQGIPFFWPLRRLNIKNPFFNFRTASNTEWCVVAGCACLTAYLWVYN